jgi:uncharacterized membrane protein
MAKAFWKSKTLWVNIIAAILLGIMDLQVGIEPQTEVLIITLINIILRIVTSEGVSLS